MANRLGTLKLACAKLSKLKHNERLYKCFTVKRACKLLKQAKAVSNKGFDNLSPEDQEKVLKRIDWESWDDSILGRLFRPLFDGEANLQALCTYLTSEKFATEQDMRDEIIKYGITNKARQDAIIKRVNEARAGRVGSVYSEAARLRGVEHENAKKRLEKARAEYDAAMHDMGRFGEGGSYYDPYNPTDYYGRPMYGRRFSPYYRSNYLTDTQFHYSPEMARAAYGGDYVVVVPSGAKFIVSADGKTIESIASSDTPGLEDKKGTEGKEDDKDTKSKSSIPKEGTKEYKKYMTNLMLRGMSPLADPDNKDKTWDSLIPPEKEYIISKLPKDHKKRTMVREFIDKNRKVPLGQLYEAMDKAYPGLLDEGWANKEEQKLILKERTPLPIPSIPYNGEDHATGDKYRAKGPEYAKKINEGFLGKRILTPGGRDFVSRSGETVGRVGGWLGDLYDDVKGDTTLGKGFEWLKGRGKPVPGGDEFEGIGKEVKEAK